MKLSLPHPLNPISWFLTGVLLTAVSIRAKAESKSVTVGPGDAEKTKVKFYSHEAGETHSLSVQAAQGWRFVKGEEPSLDSNPDNLWSGTGSSFQMATMDGRKENEATVKGKIEPVPMEGKGGDGKPSQIPFNVTMITRYFTMVFLDPLPTKTNAMLGNADGAINYSALVELQNAIGGFTSGDVTFSSPIATFQPAGPVPVSGGTRMHT